MGATTKAGRTGLAVLAVAAMGLTACGGAGGAAGGGSGTLVDGGTFTMALPSDPGSLDPHMTVLSITRNVDRFLYARLVDPALDGTIAAGLAQEWSADTTTASFTLREGLTCSDGSPLTATQVAQNIGFVGDPANTSPLLGVQVVPGTTATADDAARTVTVTSGAPDAFLLRNVGTLPIVCGVGLTDRSVLATGQGGTGMFTMTEAVPGDHYTLTRREDFTWGPGDWAPDQPGLPDRVVFRVVQNETTATNLLLSGELNAATIQGPDQQRLLAQEVFHEDNVVPIGELFFNQGADHPAQDEAVRRALVQAVDLTQVGQVLTNGTGTPSQGAVTVEPRVCTGDTVTGHLPPHDPAAAQAALDAAGWVPGPDGVRARDGRRLALTVVYGTQLGPTAAAAAELVQQAWTGVGAEITLRGVDSPGLNTLLFGTGAWDVSMAPLTLNLPSQLVPFVSGPVPPDGTNFGHVANAEYDRLVGAAAAAPGAEGCDRWNAAETALVQALDVVPFANAPRPFFGAGARFAVDGDGVVPTSVRMYG